MHANACTGPQARTPTADPRALVQADAEGLRASLAGAGIGLVALADNPVDGVWGTARPAAPASAARVHALANAGAPARDKLRALARECGAQGSDALVLSALDEVAWALNLRGADVPHCPVVLAYAIVRADASAGDNAGAYVRARARAHVCACVRALSRARGCACACARVT